MMSHKTLWNLNGGVEEGQLFKFTTFPNELACSPRLYTKLLKPVMTALHRRGFISTIFIYDTLVVGFSELQCIQNVKASLEMLEKLGFVVHPCKSTLTPSHTITYLGFEINSSQMTITLTRERKKKIYSSASKLLIWVQFLHGHQTVQCGAANAEVKVHLKRTQSLKVLSFGVGQYIAIHATLTSRDFFLD